MSVTLEVHEVSTTWSHSTEYDIITMKYTIHMHANITVNFRKVVNSQHLIIAYK